MGYNPRREAGLWVAIPGTEQAYGLQSPFAEPDYGKQSALLRLLGCHPLAGSRLLGCNPRLRGKLLGCHLLAGSRLLGSNSRLHKLGASMSLADPRARLREGAGLWVVIPAT